MSRKPRLMPFDESKYLDDAQTQAAYLAEVFASGDVGHIAHGLGVVAKARGMTSIAKEAGVAREALYRALSETGNPELGTVLRVMQALGLELTVKVPEVV